MKKLILISYWTAAVIMVACILTSLGYRFSEALFIGTTFLPGALAVRYFYPKASSGDRTSAVKNVIFLTLGILVAQIFIVLVAHIFINNVREGAHQFYGYPELPEILTNPVFIAMLTAVPTVGYHFMEKWLNRRFPAASDLITFLSDRKSITLKASDILYIESNDSVTTVYATDGRHFRNKTPISHWEANLGTQFIRIHRSYLVNRAAVTKTEFDTAYIGDVELPVSRKYRNSIPQSPELLQEQ